MFKIFTQHRYLLWQFTKRQIEQRHRGSLLGIFWGGLQPLLLMLIYTVVFGMIFKGSYAGIKGQTTWDYALGVFLSITIFQTVAEVMTSSATTILNQPNLVKKVVFPLEILPLANLGAALYQFVISMTLVLIGIVFIGQGLSLQSLWFVVTFLPLLPMTLGIAFLVSALGVFMRDIQHAVGPVSMVMLYASAVFYSATMVPPALWTWLRFNPVLHVVEQARSVLLGHAQIDWLPIGYSFVAGLVLMFVGLTTFRKLKPTFADVI